MCAAQRTMRGFDRERAGWARCASVPVKVAAVRSGTRPQKWAAPIVDLAQEEAASALFTVYMQWSAENGCFVWIFGSPAQPGDGSDTGGGGDGELTSGK